MHGVHHAMLQTRCCTIIALSALFKDLFLHTQDHWEAIVAMIHFYRSKDNGR